MKHKLNQIYVDGLTKFETRGRSNTENTGHIKSIEEPLFKKQIWNKDRQIDNNRQQWNRKINTKQQFTLSPFELLKIKNSDNKTPKREKYQCLDKSIGINKKYQIKNFNLKTQIDDRLDQQRNKILQFNLEDNIYSNRNNLISDRSSSAIKKDYTPSKLVNGYKMNQTQYQQNSKSPFQKRMDFKVNQINTDRDSQMKNIDDYLKAKSKGKVKFYTDNQFQIVADKTSPKISSNLQQLRKRLMAYDQQNNKKNIVKQKQFNLNQYRAHSPMFRRQSKLFYQRNMNENFEQKFKQANYTPTRKTNLKQFEQRSFPNSIFHLNSFAHHY